MTIFPIDGWDQFVGVKMWLMFDGKCVELDERFSGDNVSSELLKIDTLDYRIV